MTQVPTQLNPLLEAAVEPQFEAIETSLDRAATALLNPSLENLQACTFELQSIIKALEEFRTVADQGRLSRSSGGRLRRLQKQVILVRSLIRQGAAFYRNAGQSETGAVLGYTPRGLERAL